MQRIELPELFALVNAGGWQVFGGFLFTSHGLKSPQSITHMELQGGLIYVHLENGLQFSFSADGLKLTRDGHPKTDFLRVRVRVSQTPPSFQNALLLRHPKHWEENTDSKDAKP